MENGLLQKDQLWDDLDEQPGEWEDEADDK
jgi:hypothetical protein